MLFNFPYAFSFFSLEILARQIKQTQLREDYLSQIEINNMKKKYDDLFEKQKDKDLLLDNELEFRKKQVQEKRKLEQQHSDILKNDKIDLKNDLNIDDNQKMMIEENKPEKKFEQAFKNNMEEEIFEEKADEEVKEQKEEVLACDPPQSLKEFSNYNGDYRNNNFGDSNKIETENKTNNDLNIQNNKKFGINSASRQENLMEIENTLVNNEIFEEKDEIFKDKKINKKVPLTIALQICFYKPIQMQKELTDKAVIQLLFQKYEFLTVLNFFKR